MLTRDIGSCTLHFHRDPGSNCRSKDASKQNARASIGNPRVRDAIEEESYCGLCRIGIKNPPVRRSQVNTYCVFSILSAPQIRHLAQTIVTGTVAALADPLAIMLHVTDVPSAVAPLQSWVVVVRIVYLPGAAAAAAAAVPSAVNH